MPNNQIQIKDFITANKKVISQLKELSEKYFNSSINIKNLDSKKYTFEIFFPPGSNTPTISSSSGKYGVQPVNWLEQIFSKAKNITPDINDNIDNTDNNILSSPELSPKSPINKSNVKLLPKLIINN